MESYVLFLKAYGGKMRNQIFGSVWILTLCLLMFFSFNLGLAKAEVYPVDISHDTLGWHITPCSLPGVSTDIWRFTNSASDTIQIFILIQVKKQSDHFYILAPGDTAYHLIGACDGGILVKSFPQGLVSYCSRATYEPCPALTPCGISVLIGLLVASTIFILAKRKWQTT